MKKIYLLALLCVAHFAVFAQITTVFWANASSGTYKTGNSTAATRTDNNIVSTALTQRGYAVFDLTTIPAGSQINSCIIGYYISSVVGGAGSAWNTYAYAGDLSTFGTAATLFPAMVAGTSVSTVTFGAGAGNQTLASTVALVAFLQANIGTKVSICWTGGGVRTYNISGETGSIATITTPNHAPYLSINYCPPPTAITASAAPTTLCEGDNLTLTGSASAAGGGTVSYAWSGPALYTSTNSSSTFAVPVGGSGIYTLTATNTCGTGVGVGAATTTFVTVNPLPTSITGTPNVCTGGTNPLTGNPSGGSWASSLPIYASIDPVSGVLTGVAAGTTTISYTSVAGCSISESVTDVDPGGTIAGVPNVCVAATTTLTDPVLGGSWSSDPSGNASIDPVTGLLTGVAGGADVISYTTPTCPPVTFTINVNDLPQPISGPSQICVGSTTTVTDVTFGGTWGTSALSFASIDGAGNLSGIAPGALDVTYTDPISLCQAVLPLTVNAVPGAISGPNHVCAGSNISLTDPTSPGLTWSGGGTYAFIFPTGNVSGVSAGVSIFTYTDLTSSCYVTTTVTTNPLPAAILGPGTICQGSSYTFTDTDPSGTWTSSNTALVTAGLTSGSVTGIAPGGGTTITYTLPTGCKITQVESVDAAPASGVTASGTTTFCTGGSVTLTGPAGAGLTYQWDSASYAIPGATSISYTASTTGAFTLVVTNIQGCPATSAPELVNSSISASLDHTTALAFCTGGDVALSANTGTAVGTITYQWNLNGSPIAGAASATYNATASGQYSVFVTVTGGGSGTCSVMSDTDAVSVNPLPSASITYSGGLLQTFAGYTSYQWYANNVGVPGGTTWQLIPPANAVYKVYVSDGNGCRGFSQPFTLTGVGVNQVLTSADVTIAPNPATSVLNITAPVKVRATITSVEGKVLLDQSNATQVDVSALADGIYLISLYDGQGTKITTTKFVKQ